MDYFHTKNGIIKIGRYPLKQGYKVYKDPLGSSTRGADSENRIRPNSALLTYSTYQLINDAAPTISAKNIPTSSITVQTEEAWDYVPNYEQNSFEATRFTYEKPSNKTISLNGNYLASSTNNNPDENLLDTFYMFNTFVYEFKNMYSSPAAYSFSFEDTMHDKEIFLGRGMLPESFNLSINGINEVQDATWSARFIGPYDFGDTESYSQNVPDFTRGNLGLRAMNTRDFVLGTSNNDIFSALISFDLSLKIDWEKKATFISYLGKNAPNWRWWGMNDITGECNIKMILPQKAVQSQNVGTGKSYSWPVGKLVWNDPTIHSLMDNLDTLSLPDFYWQTPSIDFQAENLTILSYKGVLHNGTVIS